MPIRIRPEHWFWLVFGLVIAGILCPFWLSSQVPAFRDGFHFYYPQAVWLESCYARGEYFPQWNPHEGLGASVEGQPTWQIFYPLRAIWLFPGLDVAQRYAVFVAVHLLLAAAGMLQAGRLMRFTSAARWLTAIAFTLSCPVLFQLNNLIYLCSASWIGWGLLPIMQLVGSSRLSGVKLGARFYLEVLSQILIVGCLITLAGDPHGAVNFALVGMGAFAYHLCLVVRRNVATPFFVTPICGPTNGITHRPRQLWLSLLALLLLALTMRQFQVALPWYSSSSRVDGLVSVTDSFHPALARILGDDSLVEPQQIFDFSLSPWSFPTVIWPTWAGHFQPNHSRWVQVIPSEGRMWIPSLYTGILTAILGLHVLFSRQSCSPSERFLLGLGTLTTLLAMGNYSLIWLLRNALEGIGLTGWAQQLPSDTAGSLYGLLSVIIPSYEGFRYPAKWSVWMVACLAVLAGCGLNRFYSEDNTYSVNWYRRFLYFIAFSGLLSGVLIALSQIDSLASAIVGQLQQAADPMLGSANLSHSLNAIVRSMLQPALVLTGVIACFRLGSTSSQRADNCRSWMIVLITLTDLACLAPQWIVSTSAPELSGVRNQPENIAALYWANTSRENIKLVSPDASPRLSETLRLQEQFLHGKLCHLQGRAALHASGSIEPQALVVIKRWLQRYDNLQNHQPELESVLRALGVSQRLILNEAGELSWKPIEAAKSLCEFIPDQGVSVQADQAAIQTCSWKWLTSDELWVELDVSQAGILLVRQINDGGWNIYSDFGLGTKPDARQLFVIFPVTAGKHALTLSRK